MKLARTLLVPITSGLCLAQSCPWELETTPNPGGSLILYGIDGVTRDNIWAAGRTHAYTPGDSVTLNYIAHWDGNQWTQTPAPQPSQLRDYQNLSDVLAIDPDDAIAVGTYNPPAGSSLAQSMRWDGSEWELMQSPSYPGGSGFHAVGKAGGVVWGVGWKHSELNPPAASVFPLAARLNGNSWEVVFVPPLAETGGRSYNRIHAIEGATEDDAWAGGIAQEIGTGFGPAAMMIRWDGSDWSQYDLTQIVVSEQFSSIESIDVLAQDDAWAAGFDYDLARQRTIPLILHWDGHDWSNIPVPIFENSAELRAITARAPDDVYASGTQTDPDGYPHALVLHYDGAQWSTVPDPLLPDFGTWFRAMATVDGEVWAAGQSNGLSAGITQRQTDCPPPCMPDQNADGILNFFDVTAFLDAMTDIDGSGAFDFFDISAFLAAYNAGCP